jgi:YidC/Oxa1 family membrane protein insertase
MFDFILNPFVTVLAFLYSILNNEVVLAIVVLTIVIRLLTYPLTAAQQRSSRKMQELQPKLKKLQEKHKNDREKLSQVQMQLYKEHGVNPFGGCLPLLIQFPILIGLYQAIIFALAATPFQLVDLSNRLLIPGLDGLVPLNNMWLGMDLTLPPTTNPQYALVLPLLVLITTWLQSKMTMAAPAPESKDGDQGNQAQAMTRSMTTIMPLMFGFFSLSFSVGLSIYFIVSNLVGIFRYGAGSRIDIRKFLGRGGDTALATATDGKSEIKTSKISKEKKASGAKPKTSKT